MILNWSSNRLLSSSLDAEDISTADYPETNGVHLENSSAIVHRRIPVEKDFSEFCLGVDSLSYHPVRHRQHGTLKRTECSSYDTPAGNSTFTDTNLTILKTRSGARTKEEAARITITVVFNAGKGCARRFHLPATYARRILALSRRVSYATEFRNSCDRS